MNRAPLALECPGNGQKAGHALVGVPEAASEGAAEGPQELGAQPRPALHEDLHFAMGDGQDLALTVGDGMGGGRRSVEELDLAEEIARGEDGERLLTDAGHDLADANLALVDDVELAPGRALG